MFRLVLSRKQKATFNTLKAWSSTGGMDLAGVRVDMDSESRARGDSAVSETSDSNGQDEHSPTLGIKSREEGTALPGELRGETLGVLPADGRRARSAWRVSGAWEPSAGRSGTRDTHVAGHVVAAHVSEDTGETETETFRL